MHLRPINPRALMMTQEQPEPRQKQPQRANGAIQAPGSESGSSQARSSCQALPRGANPWLLADEPPLSRALSTVAAARAAGMRPKIEPFKRITRMLPAIARQAGPDEVVPRFRAAASTRDLVVGVQRGWRLGCAVHAAVVGHLADVCEERTDVHGASEQPLVQTRSNRPAHDAVALEPHLHSGMGHREVGVGYCIRCRVFTKAVESQTVAAFSPGLRAESSFRARSSSGKLSALLLG